MTEQKFRDSLNKVLIRQIEIESADIQPHEHLNDNLGIDSIDAVDLIVRLKELTGLQTRPEHFKHVRTMDDVVQVVSSLAANT